LLDGVPLAFVKEDNDMEHFIGIGVSLEASAVCVMDQGGAVLKETKVPSEGLAPMPPRLGYCGLCQQGQQVFSGFG
jgi:hypothetical protein